MFLGLSLLFSLVLIPSPHRHEVLSEFNDNIVASLPILLRAQSTLVKQEQQQTLQHHQQQQQKEIAKSKSLPLSTAPHHNALEASSSSVKARAKGKANERCPACQQKISKRHSSSKTAAHLPKRLHCATDPEQFFEAVTANHQVEKSCPNSSDEDDHEEMSDSAEIVKRKHEAATTSEMEDNDDEDPDINLFLSKISTTAKTKKKKHKLASQVTNPTRTRKAEDLLAINETISDVSSDNDSSTSESHHFYKTQNNYQTSEAAAATTSSLSSSKTGAGKVPNKSKGTAAASLTSSSS